MAAATMNRDQRILPANNFQFGGIVDTVTPRYRLKIKQNMKEGILMLVIIKPISAFLEVCMRFFKYEKPSIRSQKRAIVLKTNTATGIKTKDQSAIKFSKVVLI